MIYGHSECLHAALAGVSDYHEKMLYLILGPISGVRFILECDLYSNKYSNQLSGFREADTHKETMMSLVMTLYIKPLFHIKLTAT